MKSDITLKITPRMSANADSNQDKSLVGHLGTHFDVMDKDFPLDYTECKGIVFDVSSIRDRDIECSDIDLEKIKTGMFVAFYSG